MSAPEPPDSHTQVCRIASDLAGRRLDLALAALLPQFSRGRLQQWIDDGQVLLDGAPCRRRDKVWGGEEVRVRLQVPARRECPAQPIALNIVFEDEDLLVLDKPAGLVVHPAAGHPDGTLQNALLHYMPALDGVPRSGLVHRLDKDTSGLLVVAKNLEAHKSLVEQLRERRVHREYRALVWGVLTGGGRIDAPIGRHPRERTRMAVVPGGREAITHYRVAERFAAQTLLAVRLETGRTHQIRVHLAQARHPLVGDATYGGRPRPPRGLSPRLVEALRGFPRQALQAIALGLEHPRHGASLRWEIPLAEDLLALLQVLRQETSGGMD